MPSLVYDENRSARVAAFRVGIVGDHVRRRKALTSIV